MTFKFIHTADWHIGKAFASFDPEKASVLREARFAAVERIVGHARAFGAGHVLVAGDIFDSPGLPDATLRKLLARLKAAPDLNWYLLPGNHDPDRERGVWQRLARLGIADNIHSVCDAVPITLADRVVLLPAPLSEKQQTEDPTQWFDQVARADDAIVIGLAHGSTQSFGGESTPSVAIRADRASASGLDYLALGDWHGVRQVADRAWYSGTPEPEGYVDNSPGYALAVSIAEPGAVPEVQKVETAQYVWQREAIELGPIAAEDALADVIGVQHAAASRMLMRLDVSGQVTLAGEARLREEAVALAATFFDLDVRWDGVTTMLSGDADGLFDDEALAGLAERLAARQNDDEEREALVARRALQLLAGFARKAQQREA